MDVKFVEFFFFFYMYIYYYYYITIELNMLIFNIIIIELIK